MSSPFDLCTYRRTLQLVSFLCLLYPSSASAAIHILSDRNSTVEINDASQGGMVNWNVDGTDHLFQQWFWYRVGSAGPEQSIDTIGPAAAILVNSDFDPGNDALTLLYSAGAFEIEIRYSLAGGNIGSRGSDVGEQITIRNTSASGLDFHFFQYSDFDLGSTSSDDTVELVNANTVRQTDPLTVFSETVVTPSANHHEIAQFATTLNRLNDGLATTLNDATGPIFGDGTWAFQWDFLIEAGGSRQISKDKMLSPVPEPASLAAWSLLGLAGFGVRRIKRRQA